LDAQEVARFGPTQTGTTGGAGYWKRAEFSLKGEPPRQARLDFTQTSWGKLAGWQLCIDGAVVHHDGEFTPPDELT
jgi:hypothetical protein